MWPMRTSTMVDGTIIPFMHGEQVHDWREGDDNSLASCN